MTTVTVILPTVGRDTLAAAVASCEGADELIVVHDSSGDSGHAARNRTMPDAQGDLIAWMDDDDVFLPWAIDAIRRLAAPDRPTVFRVDCPWNGVVWKDQEVKFGNVSTQGIVVPNIPDQLGVWGTRPGGDFAFLASTVAKMGEPKWVETVIAVLRPHTRPTVMERYLA